MVSTIYSPTFSGFEFKLKNKVIICEILSVLRRKNKISCNELDKIILDIRILSHQDKNGIEKKFQKINSRIEDKIKEFSDIAKDLDLMKNNKINGIKKFIIFLFF